MMKTLVLGFFLFSASAAFAQSCPTEDSNGPHDASEPSMLHGILVHHDELRIWIGLKLSSPACGETEIQLTFDTSEAWRKADSVRSCGVTATGVLFLSPTGYYSTRMAMQNPKLKPDDSCHPAPVDPDLSNIPVPAGLQAYRVSITIDTRGKGHTTAAIWADPDARESLTPWQAYTHFSLNGGGDVLWFGCRDGFEPGDVTQAPESSEALRSQSSDLGVGLQVDSVNTVSFVCRRSPPPK